MRARRRSASAGAEPEPPSIADRAPGPGDTKEALLDAAEHLFARDGIHGARLREITELARQRNPSAVHYHFGSRRGLVEAIMLRHQSEIDKLVERRLDELEAAGALEVHDVIAAVIEPTLVRLRTASGRAWAQLLPQILGDLSTNLRRGVAEPSTPQSHRVLDILGARIAHLPEPVRRERLVDYALVLSTLVADRAHQLDSTARPTLSDPRFARHLVGVLAAVVTAPLDPDVSERARSSATAPDGVRGLEGGGPTRRPRDRAAGASPQRPARPGTR